jgi:hypothetical protein
VQRPGRQAGFVLIGEGPIGVGEIEFIKAQQADGIA